MKSQPPAFCLFSSGLNLDGVPLKSFDVEFGYFSTRFVQRGLLVGKEPGLMY